MNERILTIYERRGQSRDIGRFIDDAGQAHLILESRPAKGFCIMRLTADRLDAIVPTQYGKREMRPIVLLKQTPVTALVEASPLAPLPPRNSGEFSRPGSHLFTVNHRASPIDLNAIKAHRVVSPVPRTPGWLEACSATCFEL